MENEIKVIENVKVNEDGSATVAAHDRRISNNRVFGSNIVSIETSRSMKDFKKQAVREGKSVQQVMEEFYSSVAEW